MAMEQTSAAENLPEIPSGTELLDIIWRDLSPAASFFFADLPENVDPSWATVAGVERFWEASVAADRARRAAAATPSESSLVTSRKRKARTTAAEARNCTQLLTAALVKEVWDDWPKAAPEQVLLLMVKRFRTLCREYEALRQGHAV